MPPETPRDYVVGYGKPPLHTRFQKGRSGNPNGRPRATPGNPNDQPYKSRRLDPVIPAQISARPIRPRADDGYVTMGGPDEATHYVTECGPAWRRTLGAVAWLTKLAATLTPKRRTRATMH